MKKLVLAMIALIAAVPAARAQYFTQGNLAVVRVGGAGQYVSSSDAGNTVSIDQYTTSGVFVNTLAIPSTGSNAFLLDGSTTEGFMTLSPNNKYLVLGGYNTPLPYLTNGVAANLSFSPSASVPRAVVTIDGNGNYAMPIANTNVFSTFNIRGAVYDGIANFWETGSGGTGGTLANGEIGVVYVGTAGSSGVNVTVSETGTGNERVLNIYNNTLYIGTGSVTHGVFAIQPIGTLPITGTNANVLTLNPGSSSSPYDFVINSANTIAYVADSSIGGIIKFTNSGTAWISNYTLGVGTPGFATQTNAEGVTADFTQNPPVIYATTAEVTGNRVVSIVDSGPAATATLLAQCSANSTGSNYFRGIRFVPGAAPIVTNPPAPVIVAAGGNATFSVAASGTAPLSYQWFSNNVAISSGTSSSVTITNTTLAQSNTLFYVVVSNSFGTAQSASAALSVVPPGTPIVLTSPPTSQTVNAGAVVTLAVSVIGNNVTYQWSLNGAPLSNGGTISGSASNTLTINGALAANAGTYTVVVSNSFGSASGGPAVLQVNDPAITQQPVGGAVLPGSLFTFTVTAAGTPPLSYQWLANGQPLNSSIARSSSFTFGALAATYSVIVSNGVGNSVTSAPAVLVVTPDLLADNFSYTNGSSMVGQTPPIGGGPWSENVNAAPFVVQNGRVQINQTNANNSGISDIQGLFTVPQSGTVLWSSFTVNFSTVPTNAIGVYFAQFEDATNFTFFGRIFALTTNAFPGTYRLGIANENGDYSYTAGTGGPSAVLPLDMAPGIDYHVVCFYDLVNAYGQLWVNPSSMNDVNSGPTTDFGIPTHPAAAYGLREPRGVGALAVGNLVVSFDYNGTGSGYAAVTSNLVKAIPVVGLSPASSTNYTGNNLTMEVGASGIGLSYQWYQNGHALTDGVSLLGSATPTLSLTGLVGTNQGSYYVAISNSVGTAYTLTNFVTVITNATLPIFTLQPQSSTNALGGSATLTAAANGSGPLSYQWDFNGNPLSDNGITIVGSQTPTLALSGLATNESGTYTLVVTGSAGKSTSQPATIFVTPPKSVSIAFLRSLFSPTTFTPSDTTTLYQIQGTVINATNLTSGNTSSYYIQDSTDGINLFITNGQNFRPALGDVVQATGVLAAFDNNLELDLDATIPNDTFGYITASGTLTNDPTQSITNALPAPKLLPWGYTANATNIPFVTSNLDGSYVYMTNAYFANAGGTFNSAVQTAYIITNNAGLSFELYLSAQVTNLNGLPIPAFAQTVAGPLALVTATYEINLTRYADIVTTPPLPPPFHTSAVLSGTNTITLTWTAVPNGTTYHVLTATNVLGPWNAVASGLTFTNTAGTYTDTISKTTAAKFYTVVSP